MKVEVIKSSYEIARIECKHVSGRWYDLTLIMDNEVVDVRKHYCLGYCGYCCGAFVLDDLQRAFYLGDGYHVIEEHFHDTWALVKSGNDFVVVVRQDAIVR